jgi:hypothetical protein
MDLTPLTGPGKPWLHLLSATPAEATDALWELEQSSPTRAAIRFVRGRKARTPASFFDEAAAALQFPYYFGDNWDAFHDCLTDLEWLRASAVVLALLDGGHVLEASPVDASKFARVLETAVHYWNHPGGPEAGRSFHVVFQAAPAEEAATLQRWHDLGLHLGKLK